MKILETERLLLRGLEQGDFKDVCKLLQDDEVMYAYEGAFNDQEVQNWLDRQFGRYRHDGFGLWGVVEKGSNELIGQCGITYQEFDGKRHCPEVFHSRARHLSHRCSSEGRYRRRKLRLRSSWGPAFAPEFSKRCSPVLRPDFRQKRIRRSEVKDKWTIKFFEA